MKKFFLVILFLGLLLRLYNLGKYPLWYDEASPALEKISFFHLPSVFKFLDPSYSLQRCDYLFLYNHSFLYYWREVFGNSEFNLRLSSVFLGVLALYAAYKLGELVYNRSIALISMFLLAISPLHIHYSQELRPYAALSFFSLLAFYSLFKLIKEDKKRYWAVYVLANITSIYCHYIMFIFLVGEFFLLFLASKRSKSSLFRLIIAHLAILFAAIPVLVIIFPNLRFILSKTVDYDLSDFPVWGKKVSFFNILLTLKNFSIGYYINFYSWVGLCVTFIYSFFYIFGHYKDNSKARVISNIILLAWPIFFIFTVSKFVKVCYIDRYFLFLLPLYLMGVSNGLYYCRKWLRYFTLAIILIFTSLGLRGYYNETLPKDINQHIGVVSKKNNINELAQFIISNFQSKDTIFVTTKMVTFPLKFYINKFIYACKEDNKSSLASEINVLKVIWIDSGGNLIIIPYTENRPPVEKFSLFSLSDIPSRVWVINSLSDPRPDTIKELKNNFIEREKYNFENLELYLFEHK